MPWRRVEARGEERAGHLWSSRGVWRATVARQRPCNAALALLSSRQTLQESLA